MSIAPRYTDQDLSIWLVNPGEDFDTVYDFVGEYPSPLPVLLDRDESLYQSYGDVPDRYGPFPLHVVIGRDGTIRYLSGQYDATALTDAIDAALAE